MERQPFKQRVRRLKALGMTESLEVGYRLSPRGEAVLTRIGPDDTAAAPACAKEEVVAPVGSSAFTDGGSGNAGA